MDTPTTQALAEVRAALAEVRAASDHLTAEIAALIRRIEDLEAHQYATGQGVASLASRVQTLEGDSPAPGPAKPGRANLRPILRQSHKKPAKAAK